MVKSAINRSLYLRFRANALIADVLVCHWSLAEISLFKTHNNSNLGSDFTPYLVNIMPGLRLTLTDPVPDVRATAAKAIGKMFYLLIRY